jgi:hypothetical protein
VSTAGIEISQLRIRTLLELLPPALVAAGAGVWDYDAVEDRVVSCGIGAHLYGLPDAVRAEGVPLARLAAGVHPDDRQMYLDRVSGLRTHGGPIDALYRTVSANGVTHKVLVRGRCDFDASGDVVHASGLVLDVTGSQQEGAEGAAALLRASANEDTLAALNLAADYGVAARRVIEAMGPAASHALRASADAFLATLAREIAAAMSAVPRAVRPH